MTGSKMRDRRGAAPALSSHTPAHTARTTGARLDIAMGVDLPPVFPANLGARQSVLYRSRRHGAAGHRVQSLHSGFLADQNRRARR